MQFYPRSHTGWLEGFFNLKMYNQYMAGGAWGQGCFRNLTVFRIVFLLVLIIKMCE